MMLSTGRWWRYNKTKTIPKKILERQSSPWHDKDNEPKNKVAKSVHMLKKDLAMEILMKYIKSKFCTERIRHLVVRKDEEQIVLDWVKEKGSKIIFYCECNGHNPDHITKEQKTENIHLHFLLELSISSHFQIECAKKNKRKLPYPFKRQKNALRAVRNEKHLYSLVHYIQKINHAKLWVKIKYSKDKSKEVQNRMTICYKHTNHLFDVVIL
jgi:hypothetical protein